MKTPLLIAYMTLAFAVACYAQSVNATVEFPSSDWIQPFPVTVTVNKGQGVGGFAKLQMACSGPIRSIQPIEREGGTFTYRNGELKVLWMNAPPEKNVLNLTFLVDVTKNTKKGEVSFSGAFYYMNNEEEPSSANIRNARFTFNEYGGGAVEKPSRPTLTDRNEAPPETEKKRIEPKPSTSPETASVQKVPVKAKVGEQASSRPGPSSPKPEPTPRKTTVNQTRESETETDQGVLFRAQVSAQQRYATSNSVANRLSIGRSIHYDQHQGWHKYTAGEFTKYRAAKVYSNELRNSGIVPGSFVVGFENGERINIQRAIELTR